MHMFTNNSAQAYREAIIALKDELRSKDTLIKELTDKLISRDFTEYKSAQNPPKDTSEITKEPESPYLDLEDVPESVKGAELDEALKNANQPRQ